MRAKVKDVLSLLRRAYFLLLISLPVLTVAERYIPFLGALSSAAFVIVSPLTLVSNKRKIAILVEYAVAGALLLLNWKSIGDLDYHLDIEKCTFVLISVSNQCADGEYKRELLFFIRKHMRYIETQLILVVLVNLAVIPFSYGYSNKYSAMWDISAFQGIYIDPHQAAYRLFISAVLLFTISVGRKQLGLFSNQSRTVYFLLTLAILLLVVRTGARVALVLVPILFVLTMRNLLPRVKLESGGASVSVSIALGVFLLLSAAVLIFAFFNSSVGSKTIAAFSGKNFDNGRGIIRTISLATYASWDAWKKVFGGGHDIVHQLTLSRMYFSLWAHNDYLQMLMGAGLLGLCQYLVDTVRMLRQFFRARWIGAAVFAALVFTAWFNGLMLHVLFVSTLPVLCGALEAFDGYDLREVRHG